MSFDDPNREAIGQPPIWTGAASVGARSTGAAPFDPGDHTVAEVNDYLAAHPDDTDRVLDLERAGKARSGVLGE